MFVTCGNAYTVSNQVKAGSGLIKGCVVQSGTCFVGGGRRSMMCTGVGQPACIQQVVTASLAGPSSCPCSENELTRWNCVVLGSLQVPQLIKKFPTFYGT